MFPSSLFPLSPFSVRFARGSTNTMASTLRRYVANSKLQLIKRILPSFLIRLFSFCLFKTFAVFFCIRCEIPTSENHVQLKSIEIVVLRIERLVAEGERSPIVLSHVGLLPGCGPAPSHCHTSFQTPDAFNFLYLCLSQSCISFKVPGSLERSWEPVRSRTFQGLTSCPTIPVSLVGTPGLRCVRVFMCLLFRCCGWYCGGGKPVFWVSRGGGEGGGGGGGVRVGNGVFVLV